MHGATWNTASVKAKTSGEKATDHCVSHGSGRGVEDINRCVFEVHPLCPVRFFQFSITLFSHSPRLSWSFGNQSAVIPSLLPSRCPPCVPCRGHPEAGQRRTGCLQSVASPRYSGTGSVWSQVLRIRRQRPDDWDQFLSPPHDENSPSGGRCCS